jgi:hypothetical protein
MKTLLSLIFAGLLLTVFSCSEGKKKGDGAAVQELGTKDCEEIAQNLQKYDVMLDGPAIDAEKNEPALPPNLIDSAEVQSLLENFIIKAKRVLELADTRVVVFSEKSKFEARIARASVYLGQAYAHRSWPANGQGAVQSSAVDYAELAARMKRDSEHLKKLFAMGITFGNLEADLAVLKKLKPAQLAEIDQKSEILMHDYVRQKSLIDRNNSWNNAAFQKMAELAMPIAGYLYNIGSTSRQLAQEKTQKK